MIGGALVSAFFIGAIFGSDVLKQIDFTAIYYYCKPKPLKEFHHDQDVEIFQGFYKGKKGKIKRVYKNKHYYGVKTDSGINIEVYHNDIRLDKLKSTILGKRILK